MKSTSMLTDTEQTNSERISICHYRMYEVIGGENLIILGPSYLKSYLESAEKEGVIGSDGISQRFNILPKGGATVACITWPSGIKSIGVSVCSKKEIFCRKRGRDIAIGRAHAAHKESRLCKMPKTRGSIAGRVFDLWASETDGAIFAV